MDLNKKLNTYNSKFQTPFSIMSTNLEINLKSDLNTEIDEEIIMFLWETIYFNLRTTLSAELKKKYE